MPEKDIFEAIQGYLAQPRELEQVLLNYYGFGRNPTTKEAELLRQGETTVSLRVMYDSKGTIRSVLTGPAFREADTAELRALISEKLLSQGASQVACSILQSTWPLKGWFRYRDRFQILPVPSIAPRVDFCFGNNPLTVEVRFRGSSDVVVNGRRLDRALRELELLLSVFVMMRLKPIKAESHWVLDPRNGDGAFFLAQESYGWPGRQALSDDFSDVGGLEPVTLVPPERYYGETGSMSFELPSNLSESFDAYYRLDDGPRSHRFLRAAYWFNHSAEVVPSGSASHVALVQAVEALMPPQSNEECPACGKPKGDGPTAAFQRFVDRFTPGIPEKDRKQFYNVRSSLTHGRGLHRRDVEGFNFSPMSTAEEMHLLLLSRVVRIVLINWLGEQVANPTAHGAV